MDDQLEHKEEDDIISLDLERIAREAIRRNRELDAERGECEHCPPDVYRLTEVDNADRFVHLFGSRVRYCHDWAVWLIYDGQRWAPDTTALVVKLGEDMVRSIFTEAGKSGRPAEVAKWAITSMKHSAITNALNLVKSKLPVNSDQLDKDPYLLNAPNGTVDLRTGELRQHDPDDMITRVTKAPYVPQEDEQESEGAMAWRTFLETTTGGDTDLSGYLQRMAGYALCGDPCEEVLGFAYGVERTGKSTFFGTISYHLGDYADQVDFSAFLKKREDSELKPELAKLQGKRWVVSSETNAGREMAEGLVKTITGNEPISARTLNRLPITWLPQFTLFLLANDKPKIRHSDGAMWRRVKVLPFNHQVAVDDTNKGLKKRLRETSGEAILAWAVQGHVAWREQGLGTCAAVEEATATYRTEMDPIGDWLAECCRVDTDNRELFASTEDLYERYTEWAKGNGQRSVMTKKDLGRELSRLLGDDARDRPRMGGRLTQGYRCIGLLSDQDELDLGSSDQGDQGKNANCRSVAGSNMPREATPNHPDHPDHPDHPSTQAGFDFESGDSSDQGEPESTYMDEYEPPDLSGNPTCEDDDDPFN